MTHKLGIYAVDLANPLGSGTFGTVYKAIKGSEVFAVKMFKEGDQTKIEEEIKALTKLNGS